MRRASLTLQSVAKSNDEMAVTNLVCESASPSDSNEGPAQWAPFAG